MTGIAPAIGAPVPSPAAGPATGIPDPIFAAIDHHKAARLAFETAVHRGSDLDEELPSEKTRSSITVHERKIVETDDPRWIESVHEVDITSDAETEAACGLLIAPTTMAGVVALLQYSIAADRDGEMWPGDLQSDDGTTTGTWHFFLIQVLIDVLPGLAVQS